MPSSAPTFSWTAVMKCERIGQPAVVSETRMCTLPPAPGSIERTMPSSTMSLRSSGSMTFLRASVICCSVGIASHCRRGRALALASRTTAFVTFCTNFGGNTITVSSS